MKILLLCFLLCSCSNFNAEIADALMHSESCAQALDNLEALMKDKCSPEQFEIFKGPLAKAKSENFETRKILMDLAAAIKESTILGAVVKDVLVNELMKVLSK